MHVSLACILLMHACILPRRCESSACILPRSGSRRVQLSKLDGQHSI